MVLGQQVVQMQTKIKPHLNLNLSYIETDSKWTIELNIKHKVIKQKGPAPRTRSQLRSKRESVSHGRAVLPVAAAKCIFEVHPRGWFASHPRAWGFNLAQKVLSQKGKNQGLGAQTSSTLSPSRGPGWQQRDTGVISPTGTSAGFNQRPGWVLVSAASREAPVLRSS